MGGGSVSRVRNIEIRAELDPHYSYERRMTVRVRTDLETYTVQRVFPADDIKGVLPHLMEQFTRELQHLIHEKEEG